MEVKLLEVSGLNLVDSAIGQCYDKGCYFPDEGKAVSRIKRVGIDSKHGSVLEFCNITFEVTASTKVLLEMTRHRIANYACKSSRYTLNKSELVFETTGDAEIDSVLEELRLNVLKMISKKKHNDILSLMLPQAYQYRWQCQFNLRSFINFYNLRSNKSAHFQIREVADEMFNLLPENIQKLIKEDVDG